MMLLLISCIFAKKTTLTGVVDLVDNDTCLVEIKDAGAVEFTSQFCIDAREGEEIIFYIKARAK